MQADLFESPSDADVLRILPMRDAKVHYNPRWIPAEQANDMFTRLRSELDWQSAQISLFGRQLKIPRLQAWYGDNNATYMYSGLLMQALPWTPALLLLKAQCEAYTGCAFNSVLANLYRDGQDSMGMHADNEPELGQQASIASLSFGESRNFDFKHVNSKEKYRVVLQTGSLLLMQGDTQTYWQHGINKSKKALGERINLTFRYVHPR